MTSNNPLSHQSKVIHLKLKGFKIGHLNIASLTKHIEELRIFIHENSFEILCINESRLDNSIYDTEVEIDGYEIVRKDRNRNGGGVGNIPTQQHSIRRTRRFNARKCGSDMSRN